jgi:hypothetical protein
LMDTVARSNQLIRRVPDKVAIAFSPVNGGNKLFQKNEKMFRLVVMDSVRYL